MESKELNIREVRQRIGWVYPDLKWLTEKEAKSANKERDKLLKSLSNKVRYSFVQSKIHTGNLSPGCLICGEGYWSCMYINALCTAHCFYCAQNRKIKKDPPPITLEGLTFDDPKDYVDYLAKLNYKGVGFSGGESLLVFDKLLTYIKKIRKRFGEYIYLWVYTNGDLVDKDKIRKLRESGLNEIRFNISARDYDLHRVELAANIINTVTVEIPAIPEDYEIVKKCLAKMQRMDIKHLNIHQLGTSLYNYKDFIKRDYTFLHYPDLPIFESEIVALKLIKYALDKRIDLPINYCSASYKDRFQGKGIRERRALLVKNDFEELTGSRYIRRLSIQDSPTNIKRIVKILEENECKDNLWSLNDIKTEIYIHGTLLKYIDFSKYILTISYFNPELRINLSSNETDNEIKLNSNSKIYIKKELVNQQRLTSPVMIKSFQKLYIENIYEGKALNYFYRNYDLRTKESLNELKKEAKLLLALKTWERLEAGFPEIY